ncbi:MAG: hypothetical protein AABW88_02415 [Nanoarchaeota archaeon]
MNKKAIISTAISDFVGYGAFVIVFLVFLLLFNLSIPVNKVKTPTVNELSQVDLYAFTDITARHVLLNFLRSDIYLPQETMKVSDYVILVAHKGSDENSLIKRQLDSYVDSYGNGCYELNLLRNGKSVFRTRKEFSGCRLPPAVTMQIPSQTGEIIEASLRLGAKP